ncbi:MAG: sulfite exporter TauE/SafE family protein [Rhodocyclaceae bacterium]|jgi:uncharacterized membrane protein YfcA|nr:sulfite exporter TauE/SafE family protein [Rhodocyclaceae bacterium]
MDHLGLDAGGWIVAAVAVLVTGISKAGLGGALGGLAVPLMALWLGPAQAAAVMLPILILMDLVGLKAYRDQWSATDLGALLPGALTGIGLGSLAFGVMPAGLVKAAIGAIAVVFAIDRLARLARAGKPAPPPARGIWWGWLWGGLSGFTSTLAHAGGPPMMVYLLGRPLSRQAFVATTVIYFAVINAAKLPPYLALGLFSRDSLTVSLILSPLVPAGVWLGLHALRHIPERPFFLATTALLGLSGLKLLWDGLT